MKKMYLLRIWTNRLLRRIVKGNQRPVIFDIEKTFPQLLELEQNFDAVKRELVPLLRQRDEMPCYHQIDPNQNYISGSTSARWNVFMLCFLGQNFADNRAKCPRTCEILDRIPNLFQSFVSILEPGKSVPAHAGPYLGYLRYHLGVKVPEINPPYMRIRDKKHVWQEGISILFDDSWDHEVYNESEGDRVVLIVDILRPMPWYGHLLNLIFMQLFGKRYGKQVARRVEDVQY
jgi:aspartyl/asparaginyl beta-hydroxylase (cupin superfamily)